MFDLYISLLIQTRWFFSLEGAEGSYFSRKRDLFLKNMQLLASQDINWWTGVVGVDYLRIIGMFLSAVFDSPCDGTHSLQRIPFVSKWCNATFLQISSDEEKLIYILDSQRVSIFSANFHCWVNNSFKWTLKLNDLSLFQHFKLIFLSLNPKLWYLTAGILIGALKLLHIGLI